MQTKTKKASKSERDPRPTILILGDQLTWSHPGLARFGPGEARVLFIESLAHARRVAYHKQKLVLVWSAMRHFAEALREAGHTVDYHESAPSFEEAIQRHIAEHGPPEICLMETAEHGVDARLARVIEDAGGNTSLLPNTMFLSSKEDFQRESRGKTSRRMEAFYRNMRRRTGLLMEGGEPVGGAWNFDKENRARPDGDLAYPPPPRFEPGAVTREVMALVEKEYPNHFGNTGAFAWPVTHEQAEALAEHFLDVSLDNFGPYQDAMLSGQRSLFHSLLSPAINLGLLEPLALCRKAEERYHQGKARLNSVEGFIRQIIGWREFVYQVYHWQMPGYTERNALGADLPLPGCYWTGKTRMRCVREVVETLIETGHAHHIQRLMVTGNFALLAGINPAAVNEWYWLAFVDAYEWVVSPNVIGMALYADGGMLASKPYAASANYLNRMSDYCGECAFDPKAREGERACPFNVLYWDFLTRHRDVLGANQRMRMVYKQLEKRDAGEMKRIRQEAAALRDKLRQGEAP